MQQIIQINREKLKFIQGWLAECPCFVLMNVPWVMVYLFEMSAKKWYVRDGEKRLYFPVVCFYLNCNCQEWVPALKCLYCVVTTQDVMNMLLLKSQVYFDFRTKTYSSHAERDVWLSCFDDTWEQLLMLFWLTNQQLIQRADESFLRITFYRGY